MRWYFAPGPVFAASVVVNLAMALLVVWVAMAQPWLGITLDLRDDVVTIGAVADDGPTPAEVQGATLLAVAPAGQPPLALRAMDVIEEPDMLGSADLLTQFYAHQDQIHAALRAGPVDLIVQQDGAERDVRVSAQAKRPLADLSIEFWTQLTVALTGLIIGSWVVCLRPRDMAARMFLLAGVGLALASGSAAVYGTREIALPLEVFRLLTRLNGSGSLLFGIGMVTLFLIYPRRIVHRMLLPLPAMTICAWACLVLFVDWPRYVPTLQDAIAITMVVLLLAIGSQVALNRRDPAARAMLGWLGLSVAIGAGGFVLTTTLPILLGQQEPWLRQSTAFLFFLLIYGGIAMAVTRYRLFDLSDWSLKILSYGVGVALLLLLDAALIYGLSLDRAPALGLALAAVGLVYLPLRDRLARRMRQHREMPAEELYKRVTEIAHGDDPALRLGLLRNFWTDLFNPLSIATTRQHNTEPHLLDNGRALQLGALPGLPALRLELADGGTRLFSSGDLARVRALQSLIANSLDQHQTYREAVIAERSRINRDMHDNIGVLLLSALHTSGGDRKDLLIRQTLTDLREIISNPDQHNWHLPRLMADLRAEIIGHLEAADIAVTWEATEFPDITVPPQVVHTLRAFLREGTSNIVRHAGAHGVIIQVRAENQRIHLSMADNGRGFDESRGSTGNGFRNLRGRTAQAGGRFDLSTSPEGTTLTATLPLGAELKEAAE
ncbi:sensor histidine kinase [Tropicibacter oceani]|uniref:ATPase n=1 Tax=Tropicibacter oceani TaxID=3058420 RepID=A0ABY8QEI1_9RHOB|nr:ATP-binding protein [Tropicibacter oceani]WGW02920.1 ATPase [Tropicibacter oceani]